MGIGANSITTQVFDTPFKITREYSTYSGVYAFYQEKGIIKFFRLRLGGMQVYRVTYTYGYNSPPDFIRDLPQHSQPSTLSAS